MSYQITKNDQPVLYNGKSIHAFDTISVIKSVDIDKRTLSMIGSTETRDRDGDRIMVAGWDLKDYVKNPVFLWAHDYESVPLAATGKVAKRKKPNPHLYFKDIRFPKAGIFPFADMILDLYNEKIINASSVGFLPTDFEEDEVDEKDQQGMMYRPMLFKKQSLLELSGVSVPSNPEALQNSMKSVIGKHFGKGKSQEADIIKAMVEGAVPTDKQYDDLMNELNIQKIEVEEERKIQVQVPDNIDMGPNGTEIKDGVVVNKIQPVLDYDKSAKIFIEVEEMINEGFSKFFDKKLLEIEEMIDTKLEQFSKSLDPEPQQPVVQADEANGNEGESDVLDHIMSAEQLPQPAPKKGFNQKSIQELSDTISKLKAVLDS